MNVSLDQTLATKENNRRSPHKPPCSNTGAQKPVISAPVANRVLIDFLSFTLLQFEDPAVASEILGLHPGLFSELDYGGMGYRKTWRHGNIMIYFDGGPGMGCHVSLSGQGCRQYESQYQTDPWLALFENVFLQGGQFTRIDLAIDNVDGLLQLDNIRKAITDGNVRSSFKKARGIQQFILGSNGKPAIGNGETIYFGSVSSRLQFRVYDKAKESGIDGHWVRFELQLREKRAIAAIQYLLSGKDVGEVTTGIISHYLNFINRDNERNTRCSLAQWWSLWLSATCKLRLALAEITKSVEQVMEYLQRQYSASIAMIKTYLGPARYFDYMQTLINEGKGRMSKRHEQILERSGFVRKPAHLETMQKHNFQSRWCAV